MVTRLEALKKAIIGYYNDNPKKNEMAVKLPATLTDEQLSELNKGLAEHKLTVDFNQVFDGSALVKEQDVLLTSRED
jgi:hypothetical protein